MNLHEKLVRLRKAKGLTQQEIAEALDVSRQAVSRWEVGTATPTLDNLAFLSRLYDVPLDYFIQEEAGSPAEIPAQVPPAAPARSGRSYTTPVCAFLAVLILGVGVLIGLNLRPVPVSDSPYLPDPAGGPDMSFDLINNPGSGVDIEKMFPSEEDIQEIERQLAAQQARREEARKDAPPRAKLSDEDARELAERYNPNAMTQEQYDSVLEALADKGVLTRDEIGYMGYKGFTLVDFSTIHEAMVIPLHDPMDQESRDLLWSEYSIGSPFGGTRFNNANGTYDVLAWADMMNTYRNLDTESWQGYHGALYDALSQVRSARESTK